MLRLISRFFSGTEPRKARSEHPEIRRAREFLNAGDLTRAHQICHQLLVAEPDNPDTHNLLGGIALHQGDNQRAIEHFTTAADIDATQPVFRQGLGIAYCNLKRLPEALDCFRRATELAPKDPATHGNLGNCHRQAGNPVEAERCYRKAISLNAAYTPAYINLADILARHKRHNDAVKIYRKALRHTADSPENRTNLVLLNHRLGLALRELDATEEAMTCYREAIAKQPDFAPAHNSLGGALLAQNDLTAAMACFRKALEIEPEFSRVHSNILLTMNYMPGSTQQQIFDESLRFDERHARKLMRGREPFRNLRNKEKILKVGYLSPDFREHSVAHFTRKLIGQHDREAVTVFCYADVDMPDDRTGQFQAQADHWVPIQDMPDDEVAARIRQDGIDILVDLAGHTSNNRLLVFARKPAPIQVNWLGYPNTTGMRAMDYRLTDEIADPAGDADRLHTEKLVRLEHGFLCYQTDDPMPPVSTPPYRKNGHITFGSFNTLRKVTPDVIRAWSQILRAVTDARLMLKAKSLEDSTTRSALVNAFAEHGITPERLEIVNSVARRHDHLDLYSRVDIGLDPFPYNGTTTTCEALWTGVPVVTLRGDRHAGRVGAGIMHRVGLPELVAESQQGYVDAACALAADDAKRNALRKRLREQMQDSPLMDISLFTRSLEAAYRQMWITWCNKSH